MLVYLPCAGITLTRFYGYHLSHSVVNGTAPRGICEIQPACYYRLPADKDTIF